MSASISIFRFESSELRTITDEHGEPWFVLADVLASIKTKTTTTSAISSIKQGLGDGYVSEIPIVDNLGRKQQAKIVAEPAASYLLARSNTDNGRKLNRYIHSEVLPSIRKTGKYAIEQKALTPSEIILMQAQQLVDLERKQAEQADQLARIEAKQEAFEKGINDFSILAYCGYKGYPHLSMEQAQRLGKAASKACREAGLPIGKVRDPRFGHINSYPETVLEQVFAGEFDF